MAEQRQGFARTHLHIHIYTQKKAGPTNPTSLLLQATRGLIHLMLSLLDRRMQGCVPPGGPLRCRTASPCRRSCRRRPLRSRTCSSGRRISWRRWACGWGFLLVPSPSLSCRRPPPLEGTTRPPSPISSGEQRFSFRSSKCGHQQRKGDLGCLKIVRNVASAFLHASIQFVRSMHMTTVHDSSKLRRY